MARFFGPVGVDQFVRAEIYNFRHFPLQFPLKRVLTSIRAWNNQRGWTFIGGVKASVLNSGSEPLGQGRGLLELGFRKTKQKNGGNSGTPEAKMVNVRQLRSTPGIDGKEGGGGPGTPPPPLWCIWGWGGGGSIPSTPPPKKNIRTSLAIPGLAEGTPSARPSHRHRAHTPGGPPFLCDVVPG